MPISRCNVRSLFTQHKSPQIQYADVVQAPFDLASRFFILLTSKGINELDRDKEGEQISLSTQFSLNVITLRPQLNNKQFCSTRILVTNRCFCGEFTSDQIVLLIAECFDKGPRVDEPCAEHRNHPAPTREMNRISAQLFEQIACIKVRR
ncbi:hypothetical protein CAL28_23140 [Bordetella genomosp. 11]|uniref:Uncharacterized protein n=1 Tax=Bordetella genomosp. 11 TaxID=1416808 RepID=A0A261UMK2_9BORD|nr:hypothetical protein CAL28_23140 [Bordetella genomosp. 11]